MGDTEFNNPEFVQTLAAAQCQFALDLYKRVRRQDENVLLCPLGVSTVLAMTLAGARDDTAAQMKESMHLDAFEEDGFVHLAFQDVLSSIPQEDQEGVCMISANRLFLQQDLEVTEEFRTLLEQHYTSEVQAVDFAQDADEARNAINAFVAEKTGDKLTELVAEGAVDMFNVLVLVSAVYFKGEWASPFDSTATKLVPFVSANGRKVMADMMHQHGEFRQAESEALQCKALELPYVGGRLSMVILLPNEADGLTALEDQLNTENLTEVLGSLESAPVSVTLPRFHVECGFSLSEILSELGSADLFNPDSANLSGLSEGEGLLASSVFHKCLVEVGERGSESSASLSASLDEDAPACEEGEAEFVVDRSFLFLIRDSASEMVMFLGRLQLPATEELLP